MKGHPIIGALVTGAVFGLAYWGYRKASGHPMQPGERNYWPWTAGVVTGFMYFRR